MTPASGAGTRVVLLLVLTAILGLSYAHNYHLGANDDRLWLYHAGAQIGRAGDRQELDSRVSTSLLATGANENKQFRYREREQYRTNYVAATTTYRVAADAVRRVAALPRPASQHSTPPWSGSPRVDRRNGPTPTIASMAWSIRFVQTWLSSPGLASMRGTSVP